ncbi:MULTISPECIES: HopJ type III effector protein [unclassified Pseudomonas]|uniref:HopJ type III effector protein n=1 Tax=unclassified Pseudomonas TaxID=196821 RepID=UPI002AC8CE70|nr:MULTISPECIES: HopJ type III effector protein [unclassified Pseudomonas]MEB0042722.1 HopJ type III effector protein [Pseudomonas sp. MH10]MEB0079918.1 HopJ type III effector protein [Pseudomonas sp. MH10out]MEB0093815.1 HopJ type III effector protein [Pseudomonas sp. CCI4.2]MEB0103492.1 HopJ type III effector protein [Pseudomonas sp. CCI3.2]MEB0121679.1 HopJ type III effector protein [Pseudomonas sp. CCI1.2]
MTDLNTLRASLRSGQHPFADTLVFIAEGYAYQPQAFTNGNVENAAGQNEGSCKIVGLAVLEGLSDEETLLAFGEHYRSVQATPEGSDHANIRSLIVNGLAGVTFAGKSLTRKE